MKVFAMLVFLGSVFLLALAGLAHLLRNERSIHASARPVKQTEVEDIIGRMADRLSSLRAEKAMPLLERLRAAHKCRGVVELAAGLGTAILGKPKLVSALFNSPADSDRIDHHMWAWPLTDILPFREPVPMRGLQGFWVWPEKVAA